MWPHSENWHTSSLCFLQKINTNLSEPFTKHMYGVWEDCIVNINKCYYKYVPVYVSSDTCFSVNLICSYKRNYHTCNKLNLTFFTTIDKQLNGTDVSMWGHWCGRKPEYPEKPHVFRQVTTIPFYIYNF